MGSTGRRRGEGGAGVAATRGDVGTVDGGLGSEGGLGSARRRGRHAERDGPCLLHTWLHMSEDVRVMVVPLRCWS